MDTFRKNFFSFSVVLLFLTFHSEGKVHYKLKSREKREVVSKRSDDAKKPKNVTVECGWAYSINDEVKLTFPMNKKSCEFSFIGSKIQNCTAELSCQKLGFKKADCAASKYVKIRDGLHGELKLCKPGLAKTAYRASHGGRDLYIEYKGPIKDSLCTVECAEDTDGGDTKFTELPPHAISRKFHDTCICGIHNPNTPRIIGGDDAIPFEFPWIAALVYPGLREPFCGGSLINDEFLLTAAHCFASDEEADITPNEVEVLLHAHILDLSLNDLYYDDVKPGRKGSIDKVKGLNLTNFTDADESSIRIKVKDVYIHPLFDPHTTDYDVAVIKLAKKVDLKAGVVTPICLPDETEVYHYAKKNATVAGWGRPLEYAGANNRILQKLDIPLLSNRKCGQLLNQDVTPRMICGGYLEGGMDTCGDSGSPLLSLLRENQFRQIGVVSFGVGCAKPMLPGIYSNIQETIQWIYLQTGHAVWCKDGVARKD